MTEQPAASAEPRPGPAPELGELLENGNRDVPGEEFAQGLDAGSRGSGRRAYPGRDAADHARRLLRRAVNADRPGEDTLGQLSSALGYDIGRLAEPRAGYGGRGWCSLYEHAFLMPDASEVRLYELEHDLTEERQLVCEVYADEASASRAARRHGRAHGGDR
ncbi:DUF6227 family protein [Streptomyces profundus]|uniref:DUF6227 family protein n=1 Tax=Streptomyces profundus TaxID=2867410 RepID=UPI001D162212|nr:DUF6227 family protein [Streptomyces sp. MA3_2.13]UED86858.1 DUF6227 family protein [Streptomyces sp. MA3_2.13]